MRVLILSAILACAVAAPSGDLKAELAVLPIATPTIDPGDIQAAAINAQVAAEDQARAAADKLVEESNEKVIESDSLVKEKNEETFWAHEDKKWQALDAVQTAEAKLDGAIANNADAIARSALGGVVLPTYVVPSLPLVRTPIIPGAPLLGPPLAPVAPAFAPVGPIIYPGLVALKNENEKELVKAAQPEKKVEVEITKVFPKNEEELVKAAEPEKKVEIEITKVPLVDYKVVKVEEQQINAEKDKHVQDENKVEGKKESLEQLIEKAEKKEKEDKLEKPVVAPLPWPLASAVPASAVYVPQILTQWK